MRNLYLIGMNGDSEFLANLVASAGQGVRVVAFVNDFSEEIDFCGFPIVKSAQIEMGAVVVNCSTSVSPVRTQDAFLGMGHDVIYITDFLKSHFPDIKAPTFQRFVSAGVDHEYLLDLMASQTSQKMLNDILRYRVRGELDIMRQFPNRIDEQYLDLATDLRIRSYADIGGFDGDTAALFLSRLPTLEQVHFFEPNPENHANARARLASFEGVEYYTFGLGKEEKNAFISHEGSASTISQNKGTKVVVKRFDDVMSADVDMLKIDIEGAEIEFLHGAQDYIRRHKPHIAIAVYHRPTDFVDIPKFILSLNCEYSVEFRHYSEGWSESIMYFLNRKRVGH